jgi:hypothetical protein
MSMSLEHPLQSPTFQGARKTQLTPDDVARNISRRLSSLSNPKAIDLVARMTFVIYETLHGETKASSGHHSPKLWREITAGEKSFPLYDLCRLVAGSEIERTAALRALRVLLHALDRRDVPPQGVDELREVLSKTMFSERA